MLLRSKEALDCAWIGDRVEGWTRATKELGRINLDQFGSWDGDINMIPKVKTNAHLFYHLLSLMSKEWGTGFNERITV